MVKGKAAIRIVQLPVDRRLEGRSSWLKVAREKALEKVATDMAVKP